MTEKEISQHLFEYQKIIQTSFDGFWVVSVDDARILEVNEAFCRMVGYSRAELLSMSISNLEAVESPEELAIHLKKVAESGYDRFETRHRHKLGHLIDLEVSVSYSGLDSRTHFAFARDITEHKRAEEALRASERQFRALAENFPDTLIRYDREGHRTYVNPALERIFAVAGKQVIGASLQDENPLGLPEIYQHALRHTLATGESCEFEMQLPQRSGIVGTGFVKIAAERGADGQISGAISIGRDITKLKQAEQQLRELAAHLQSVREEEKTRLAREIHDDLGSTLAALKLRLSHLMDFELPDNMKETTLFTRLESMSQILESAIASTRRIVTDMRPDVLDNLGLFAALKWQAERFNQHTGIACRIVCANDDNCADCKRCEFHLDETLSINLFRIFQEALSNVARHSGASSVKAEYRPAVDHVFLSISDDGRGLPDGHVPASTSFGIRGMRERVVQLGGQIKFDSPGGSGLCVTVILPLTSVDTANVGGRA